jgi:predicted type IV restriction endonuclease
MALDIRKPLKKLLPHLIKAQEDNLNEADTLQRILKVFEEVLGYHPLDEISRETQVKDRYVDAAIKLDGTIRLLVEAKSAATVLRDRHIEQAQHYAAQANIPWVLLTNGVVWNLYHLSFEEGIEYVRVFAVDLAVDDIDKAAESLSLLHRQSIKKGALEEYWEHRAALSPDSIARPIHRGGPPVHSARDPAPTRDRHRSGGPRGRYSQHALDRGPGADRSAQDSP